MYVLQIFYRIGRSHVLKYSLKRINNANIVSYCGVSNNTRI